MAVKPVMVKEKHNEALVYVKALESTCENKIRQYLDHPAFAGTTVRVMPDVHLGKGTVIGWTDPESPIKYLSGNYAEDYLADMMFVQQYAWVNRALMAHTIAKGFFGVDIQETEYRDSVHNYIDTASRIIRKGAISAESRGTAGHSFFNERRSHSWLRQG